MIALGTVFAAASLVFLIRLIFGTFHFLISVNSPLNAEGIAAVSFLGALIVGAKERSGSSAPVPRFALVVCVLAATAAFLPNLTTPLIHDSWSHIGYAASDTFNGMLHHAFIEPRLGTDPFFRPIGFASFLALIPLVGINPPPGSSGI